MSESCRAAGGRCCGPSARQEITQIFHLRHHETTADQGLSYRLYAAIRLGLVISNKYGSYATVRLVFNHEQTAPQHIKVDPQ